MKFVLRALICLAGNFVVSHSVTGQYINSMTVDPVNPTTVDSIFIFCSVTYPNVSCPLVQDSLIYTGNSIIGQAIHCDANSAVLCSTVDTFVISPLSAGTYWFHYWPGYDLSCWFPVFGNGDTIPYPYAMDSIQFTVTQYNATLAITANSFSVSPNPSHQAVNLTLPQGTTQIEIFNAVGQAVSQVAFSSLHQVVDVSLFSEGIYFVIVQSNQGVQTQKFVVQR